MDNIANEVLGYFREAGSASFDETYKALDTIWSIEQIGDALDELTSARVLVPATRDQVNYRAPTAREIPLGSLVIMLSMACNLACRYCYAEGGTYGRGRPTRMSADTAREAVDFLVDQSGEMTELSISLFGGEPLLNADVLRSTVRYAQERARAAGKSVRITLTTNATLLDRDTVRFLDDHRVGLSISIDGKREEHDRMRPRLSGRGSYDAILEALQVLTTDYRGPLGARVTVTRQHIDLPGTLRHLLDLGFYDVGFAPVTTPDPSLALGQAELEEFTRQLELVADEFVRLGAMGRYLGCSNIAGAVRELHRGPVKSLACGAAQGLMSVDADGSLYMCHRLVGRCEARLGSLDEGIDEPRRHRLLTRLDVSARPDCRECWARRLCGGGCHHEVLSRGGQLSDVPAGYCHWLRRWYDIALGAYVRLCVSNPEFLSSLDPRPRC